MTYEAEKFTKKKFPIILFAVTKAVNLISLNSVSLLYVWNMCVGGGRVYIVSWVTQTPPPQKYSQTNNNLPKKASSTNKKASLERIILNIE